MTDMKSMSKSELEDKLTACLKKAGGIAALINLSTVADGEVLPRELEWASWALMDFISDAQEASEKLSNQLKEAC